MDDDEDDVHFCLTCNKTVKGLINYIHHKKTECTGKKNKVKSDTDNKNTDILKFENQSFPSVDNSTDNAKQSTKSYRSSDFGTFNKVADDAADFNGSFLNSTTGASLHDPFDSHVADRSVYGKSVSTGVPSTSPENLFISTQINLSSDASVVTLENNLSCALSPIFSTSVIHDKDDLPAVTEDYGILTADISGNRNNQPVKRHDAIKIQSNNLHGPSQLAKGSEFEQVDDFFQSLELMSRTERKVDKGGNCNQLPISNILNNLTFSDDEDLGFNFDEDLSLGSESDESDDEDDGAPPGDYTGGKWKPGEKPMAYKKHRHRGKWPPGEGPTQTSTKPSKAPVSRGKNITLIPGHGNKHSKAAKKPVGKTSNKTFACNFCNVTFDNRFKYSNHCGGKQHKENVFGKKDVVENEESEIICVAEATDESYSDKPTEGNAADGIETTDDIKAANQIEAAQQIEATQVNDAAEKSVADLEEEGENEVKEAQEDSIPEVTGALETVAEDNKTDAKEADVESVDGYETDEYFNDEVKKESIASLIATPVDSGADPVQVLVQVHVCTICDKKFESKYLLARHLLTKFHRNRALAQKEEDAALVQKYQKCIIRLSPYQCAICRYYYTKNEEFVDHLLTEEHEKNCKNLVGEMQCTLCRFKSHSLEEILKHVKSEEHIEKIDKHNRICVMKECHASCTCKFCGLETYSYTRLQQHIKKKHSDGKPVAGVKKRQVGVRNRPKCDECGVQMSSPSALALHIRRQHSNERPYYCECCDSSFADKHSLQSHRKTTLHSKKSNEYKAGQSATVTGRRASKKQPSYTEPLDSDEEELDNSRKSSRKKKNAGNKEPADAADDKDNLDEDINMEALGFGDEWKPPSAVKKSGRKRSRGMSGETIGWARKNKAFRCNHCDFTVMSYDDLRPHYMKEHSKAITICELCDVVFLSEKAYKLHVLSKEHQSNINASGKSEKDDQKYFQCHVCKKKFTDEKYCNFHTAYQHLHLTTEDAVFKDSGNKSVTREKYADFLQSVRNKSLTETLKCPECNTSIKKSNLMVHLRTHTDERPFLCRICPKKFRSNYNLRKHLLGHFGCLERHCDICGKDFSKPSNFEEHMELHVMEKSNTEKTNICDFCGQSFFLPRQLSVHMRRHRKKDLKCDVPGCHWTFAFNHELKTHKMTHSEDRPFLCDTCGFAAYSPYHLKRHKRIHNNERKFHCEYCTYKAGNKTHLRRHMRIHIGSKPFKCPYCEFACNTHENIRKHILETKKHDGLKVYPCKFCSFATNSSKDFRGHLMAEHSKETDDGARHVALSVFTGLFHKHEDLEKPAEGMQVLPCKERKFSRRKSDIEDARSAEGQGQAERKSQQKTEKKPKRKRKSEPAPEIPEFSVQNMAMDMTASTKNSFTTYQHEPLREDDRQMPPLQQPYPMSLVTNKQTPPPPPPLTPSPVFHQPHPYHYIPNTANPNMGGMPDMGMNMGEHQGPGPSHPVRMNIGQNYMKHGGPPDNMMPYGDYSHNKYHDVPKNSNTSDHVSAGNLVIDMNYSQQH